MRGHCEVYRGPEWVDVPLIDIKVRACSYLILISESITMACDSIASRQKFWWHGWAMLPSMATLALVTMLPTDLSATPCACSSWLGMSRYGSPACDRILEILSTDIPLPYLPWFCDQWLSHLASSQDVHRRVLTYWLSTLILTWTLWTQGIPALRKGLWIGEHPLWPTLWWVNASTTNCCH